MINTTVAHPPDLDERIVRELTHRINNQLASAINLVTAAAAGGASGNQGRAGQCHRTASGAGQCASLLEARKNSLVDAAQYLRKLCLATTRSRLEPIGVHLSLQADTLLLEPERCWRLGMALHELMTNSAQHACFDDRAGEIKVKLSLAHPVVNCIIVDNGSLFKRLKPARGLGLVRDLIKSLGGRLEYGFGPEHSSFLLVFLLTERERRANRAVASRRARRPRRLKTIRSISDQTAAGQFPNPAGIPSSLHGPTPASNAPEGAPLLGAARTTDKADVLTQLFAKPRL